MIVHIYHVVQTYFIYNRDVSEYVREC